jgi:glycosyltransferase involved in cell wall biosynthesis
MLDDALGTSSPTFLKRIRLRLETLIFDLRKKRLLWTRQRFRLKAPQARNHARGINLAGYLRAEMGLGEAARGIATALESVAIPFNVINFEYMNPGRHTDMSWIHKEAVLDRYHTTVLAVNPDNIVNARLLLPKEIFSRRYVIGYWFWELPEVPDHWATAFSLVNEVWAASRFMQESFTAKSPVPVTLIPPPIVPRRIANLSRSSFRLPERTFLFLTICDVNSTLERKNPLGSIRAFKKAFAPDDSTVGLVLKLTGMEKRRPEPEEILKEISGYENIYVSNRMMKREEVNSLLACTDCVVSLHRSEGFGLIPAEAMSLGKPVILTNWSGNTDYMTPDNCAAIDYKLVELERDYGPYKSGQYWADPDVEQAASWMQKLAREPDVAQRIGKAAQETITVNFSPAATGKKIEARLKEIEQHL